MSETKNTEHVEINYSTGCITITYIVEKEPFKYLRLIYSDDYAFSGFSDDIMDLDELIFFIESDNPLYFPLLHFIGEDEKVTFASDFKKSIYDKLAYIEVSKSEEVILFKLVNKIKEEQESITKFDYEIKNIMFDMRSKLDANGTNIKERLYNFFDEAITEIEESQKLIKKNDK